MSAESNNAEQLAHMVYFTLKDLCQRRSSGRWRHAINICPITRAKSIFRSALA